MLGNEPIMAGVATTDPDRARGFYEGVLGLTLEEVTSGGPDPVAGLTQSRA